PSGSSVGTLPQWLCVRSVLCTPFGPAILPASSRSSSSSALSPTACTHPISSVFVAAIPATIGNSNWRSCAASAWMGGRGPCSLPALSALFFIGGSLSFRTVSSWQSPSSGRPGSRRYSPIFNRDRDVALRSASSPSQNHVDRAPQRTDSDARRIFGRLRSSVRRSTSRAGLRQRHLVDSRMLDLEEVFVPGSRAEQLEGQLNANLSIVRCEAALGNHGGFFHFWRSIMK